MSNPLLATKLQRPNLQTQLVARQHLFARLTAGQKGRLTLVSAPAGFGKTMLVAQWLAQLPKSIDHAWLSLGEEDNQPLQFFRYLAAALHPFATNALLLPALLQGDQAIGIKALTHALAQDAAAVSRPLVLVLDDFHFIQAPDLQQAITFLIEHLPPHLHLVLITRIDPQLPLARLRARRQLTEIRTPDLRFSNSDTAVFFNHHLHLNLTTETITLLEKRTEGWLVGLQLAALSLEQLPHAERVSFIESLSGSNRHIVDYLLEEVIRQQPPDIQLFLQKTAVLSRLSAPLCAALLGDDLPNEAAAQLTLERLEQANLFLIPLDQKRRWYRYHHLFGDLLAKQLEASQPAQIPILHIKASRWFEAQGLLSESFAHATKTGDQGYLVSFLERHVQTLLVTSELTTLLTWLQAVPPHLVTNHPQLAIFYAWAAAALLDEETAVSALTHVDNYADSQPISAAEKADWRGQAQLIRGLLASKRLNIPEMVTQTRLGLANLAPDNQLFHGLAASNLATAQWFGNDTAAACTALETAVVANRKAGNLTEAINLLTTLAQSTFEMGQLHQTETICQDGLRIIDQFVAAQANRSRGSNVPISRLLWVQLGQLYREWNRTEEGIAFVQKGLAASKATGLSNSLMLRMALAVLFEDAGDPARAIAELDAIQRLSKRVALPRILGIATDIQALIYLRRGELTAVQQWMNSVKINLNELTHFFEPRYLIFAHALIAHRRWSEAERLLNAILQMARAGGRTGRVIHALVLSALLHQQQGSQATASTLLAEAVGLAEPERFVRTFLDAGQPIANLLRKLAPQTQTQHDYIQTLLDAFLTSPPIEQHGLIEPLSVRELELLRLVANGRSNRQIADELHLALGTVKKHLSNIFGKLGVSSRTQAVAAARDHNLI